MLFLINSFEYLAEYKTDYCEPSRDGRLLRSLFVVTVGSWTFDTKSFSPATVEIKAGDGSVNVVENFRLFLNNLDIFSFHEFRRC